MNILWITNGPIVDGHLQMLNTNTLKGSGGWLQSSLSELKQIGSASIIVACPYSGCNNVCEQVIEGITYILLPIKSKIRYSYKLERYWRNIKNRFNPSIIHIHGSEFPIGLSYINACGSKGVVLSIQGLVSEIKKYNLQGLTTSDLIKSISLKDLFSGHLLYFSNVALKIRAYYEVALISKVQNIIGRTNWDRSHIHTINPKAQYYNLNEMLRDPFLVSKKWNYDTCKQHSIFVSQAYTPLKGLHFLIKAFKFVVDKYPDATLFIAGPNIIYGNCLTRRGYGKIIYRLLKKYNLLSSVHFTGPLEASQMVTQLLSANCYVLCSSIENSPNSVCEAQLLGTPVVASFVGGVPDFIENQKTGFLYRVDDISMLADNIINVFFKGKSISSISLNEIEVATVRHDSSHYGHQLLDIYEEIINRSY